MSHDELNVNVTMYQDEGHNGQPLPENTGSTSDDRMDIANALGADLGLPLELALQIAERILLSEWRRESLMYAWHEGATAATYSLSAVRHYAQNPYL
jgi:hypothetical protein